MSTIKAHSEPLIEALKAYGIDPMQTPQRAEIESSDVGISIDQYLLDADGELVTHKDARGRAVEAVTVKRFYPHPAPAEPWTTIPEHTTP